MENQDLKKAGLKVTLPRVKILEIMEGSDTRHLSAEDIYKALQTIKDFKPGTMVPVSFGPDRRDGCRPRHPPRPVSGEVSNVEDLSGYRVSDVLADHSGTVWINAFEPSQLGPDYSTEQSHRRLPPQS